MFKIKKKEEAPKKEIELREKILKNLLEEVMGNSVNSTLFGNIKIKVGDVSPFAFDPERVIQINADSTGEFLKTISTSLTELREPPMPKKVYEELERKMSDAEMDIVYSIRTIERIKKDQAQMFN